MTKSPATLAFPLALLKPTKTGRVAFWRLNKTFNKYLTHVNGLVKAFFTLFLKKTDFESLEKLQSILKFLILVSKFLLDAFHT